MLFPTISFALFFTGVFVASWLLMSRLRAWKWFILGASYVFYATWDLRLLWLLPLTAVVNHLLALAIASSPRGRRRTWLLVATLAFDLGLLGYFKYYDFFVTSAADSLATFGLRATPPLLQVLLPVGLSFLTFRLVSYVVDVYRGTLAPAGLLDLAVYVAFFPYLLAGPIVRASEFLPQLRTSRDPRYVDATRAFYLVAVGLFKKVVIADYLAVTIVNPVFADPQRYSALETLVGIVAYAVQIYCDFSAYSDIAIGIALLLGFRFPDNFHAPYAAMSVRDFWRRWHITLSSWIRDYLYIPLGGSRGSRAATCRNLMISMLLAGLWHGASWTFVFWGGLHGAGLTAEHWTADRRRLLGRAEPRPTAARLAWHRVLTFAFVCFGWVFFRSESFAAAWSVLSRLVTGLDQLSFSAVTPPVVALIALGIGGQFVPDRLVAALQRGSSRLDPVLQGALVGLAIFVVSQLGPQGAAPFLYFRF
jgi:alginate O-acetyltransferase complex protein AlgI